MAEKQTSPGAAATASGATDSHRSQGEVITPGRRRKGLSVTFEVSATGRRFEVFGQTGKTLLALSKAGDRGVTALECSTWAFRLAAYCHDLRKHFALEIVTLREEHPGGWHGRHVLRTPVRILTIHDTGGA